MTFKLIWFRTSPPPQFRKDLMRYPVPIGLAEQGTVLKEKLGCKVHLHECAVCVVTGQIRVMQGNTH